MKTWFLPTVLTNCTNNFFYSVYVLDTCDILSEFDNSMNSVGYSTQLYVPNVINIFHDDHQV